MQKVKNTRVMDMTEGSAAKLLFAFALPIFLGNLFQQLYNLADTAIAGHMLGDGALAQIGATAALYSMITGFAFGLNTGFALVVSRFFGAGDQAGSPACIRLDGGSGSHLGNDFDRRFSGCAASPSGSFEYTGQCYGRGFKIYYSNSGRNSPDHGL